jgi:hypothetical protein
MSQSLDEIITKLTEHCSLQQKLGSANACALLENAAHENYKPLPLVFHTLDEVTPWHLTNCFVDPEIFKSVKVRPRRIEQGWAEEPDEPRVRFARLGENRLLALNTRDVLAMVMYRPFVR